MQLNLLSDSAVDEPNSNKKDGLGFSTYAKVLTQAAIDTKGPFAIGIFGEWGTGKTSLLQMIQKNLALNSDVITIWFNAWHYEQDEHPIIPLIATIIKELNKNKKFFEKLEANGNKLIKALRAIAYGFSAKTKISIPGYTEIEAAFVAKEMIERNERLSIDPLLDKSIYYESIEALSAIKMNASTRIVILIDDLDRCFPDRAIKLLESIKLVLSQQGFIFIIGVARSIIEGFLRFKFEKEYGISKFEGHSYLDKLIQLPFYIPSHRGRIESFSDSLMVQVPTLERDILRQIMPIIGVACGCNPRAIIRFVNNLLVDRAINKILSDQGEMEVIEIGYFALTRSLQQRWPTIFVSLMVSDEMCRELAGWKQTDLQVLASSSTENFSGVARLMAADIDLRNLMFSTHGEAWLSNSEKRNATIDFLRDQRNCELDVHSITEMEYDIVLCYVKEDIDVAIRLTELLSEGRKKLWIDEQSDEQDPAKDLPLENIIKKTRILAALISGNSTRSPLFLRKIENYCKLYKQDNKILIPIITGSLEDHQVPAIFSHIQWIDIRNQNITVDKLVPLLRS